jgi:dolichol-phosphate mannosyltransferase
MAVLAGGLALAFVGWVAWSPHPDSSQEAVANLAKAEDFFRTMGGPGVLQWWTPDFLGGTSLAPLWGTVATSAWLMVWVSIFGAAAGSKLALLACVPVAAVAMYGFLKRLSGREGVAAVGGLAYAMAPSLWMRMLYVEHAVVVCALAVLPLTCWALARLTQRPTPLSALLAAGACSLLALTYSKAALLSAPVLLAFVGWGLWRGCGFAGVIRARVMVPLAGGLCILGLLPNLPALRESAHAALFEFGPLVGWQQAFSTKSGLQVADRLGALATGFRGDYAATTAAGGIYLGAVPLLLVALVLMRRRELFARDAVQTGLFRACAGLALFAFWLSFGPFSVVSGTLRALEASAPAADVFPALLWLALVAQGWILWALLPLSMPLRKPFGILLLAVYFLVPGFPTVSWLGLYRDIRAPFDFYQVAGVVWACAAAALAAGMLYRAAARPLRRLVVVAVLAAIWGLDFAGHLGLAARRALPGMVRQDFEAAAAMLRDAPEAGSVWAVSGRYFYLRLPGLTGRPIIQEAFQSYLQQRGYAALQAASSGSPADITEYLRVAGVGFVLLDTTDPDLPEDLPGQLAERLPQVFKNAHFEVYAVRPGLAPAYVAKDAVLLASEEPADIAGSLAAAGGDFVVIGPILPGTSAGTIREGTLELNDSFKGSTGRPFIPLAPTAVSRPSRHRIEADVPPGGGWLVVPEAWHPDWRVGGIVPLKAFGALLASEAPAEGGRVVFEFRPPWWYGAAVGVSVLGWAGFALAVVFFRRRLDVEAMTPQPSSPRLPIANPLAICPTYNEAASLPRLLDRVFAAGPDLHVLIVDDGSPDGTQDVVRGHPHYGRQVFLLARSGKLGLGSAYREGFRWAAEHGHDACIEIDADLSHDPADIPRLIGALDAGADAAIGSRYLGGLRVVNWPEHRLLLSACATQFVRLVTGMPLTDATSGFKALRRAALDGLDWGEIRADGYGFQVELHHALWKSGARIVEVPITFTERREGETKMTPGIAIEAMRRVIELALRGQAVGVQPSQSKA